MSFEEVGLRTDFVGGLRRQTQNFGSEGVVETIDVGGISLVVVDWEV